MTNPLAFFDMLYLGQKMSDLVDGFSRPELHLLAYASCLLSLYEGQPVAEWGYDFISAQNGLPFSQDFDVAVDQGLSLDHLQVYGSLIRLSDEGIVELQVLRSFEVNKERERYLAGAADSLLVFSPGNVREAFDYDPTISFLKQGRRTAWVLTEAVTERLYGNFQQLRSALDYDAEDLSVPMITWLRYLIQTGRHAQ